MASVIEHVYIPLKAGVDTADPDSTTGSIWQECVKDILRNDGAIAVYCGQEVEDPSRLHIFVEWDKVASHEAFQASPAMQPFYQKIYSISIEGGPRPAHFNLAPHARAALSTTVSPVTEICRMVFPGDVSEADQSGVVANLEKFAALVKPGEVEGLRAGAHGWSVENNMQDPNGEGKNTKHYMLVLGWDSVEAHMKFRETSLFKDNIGLLRDAPGLMKGGLSATHASLTPHLKVPGQE